MEQRREQCVTCSRSVARDRNRHVITREYMENRPEFTEFVMERINVEQAVLNEIQLMCFRCWVSANRREAQTRDVDRDEEQNVQEGGEEPQPTSIPTYKRLANTSRHCVFNGCLNIDLHRAPLFLKRFSLIEYNLYVPSSARVCTAHMHIKEWDELYEIAEESFSPEQIKDMLDLMKDAFNSKGQLDFDEINSITHEELYFRTGLTHDQFASVINETPSLAVRSKRPQTVLGAYLMKIRSAEPNDRIACHLNMTCRTLEKYLTIARECLTTDFVPRHLGLDHISRDEIIRRNLTVPTALCGNETEPKAISLCDGTYIYIQKSMNFLFQKNKYKYKNLLKPFLIVCSDGYIVEITGPHAAAASDATIINQIMDERHAPIHYLLHARDVFILDRGFRDAIPNLEEHGYETHMPPYKDRSASQLSNDQANESRKITIVRWVIEVINGWFKRDFKIFRNQVFNKSLPNLFIDFRIAGALLNSFRDALTDSVHAATFVEIINERMHAPNRLGSYVTEQNINRQRASFATLTDDSIDIPFPVLTEEDIVLFSLGTYHIKLARSYVSEHIRNGIYTIEVCANETPRMTDYGIRTNGCILLRGRILSRHVSNKIYYTYILFSPNAEGRTAIQEYYCSCLTGMRTIRACAHTVSIIWYFGIGRHLENFVGPASAWDDIIVKSRNTL